ncbi:DUF1566 domain-containing protein [Leptospira sp. 'Mane']|uniref:Lcl domain-containing protein n=1 Tax=Leptospira sp. 'Mane' TaxID=3387407 RepID=UPI00398AA1EC
MNSVSYAGKTNWRLVTLDEIANIVNYQNITPPIDASYFPATTTIGAYWTNVPYAINVPAFPILRFRKHPSHHFLNL